MKLYLDDLQEASIRKKKKSPQLPQIVQIRQQLHTYWGGIANFMQIECYQTVKTVINLQDVKGPVDLITAIESLEAEGKNCSMHAKRLVGQHDQFVQFFPRRNIRFPGSDTIIANFMQACAALRAALVELSALIDKQWRACAIYKTRARSNYTPALLNEITLLGKQWQPYRTKINETHGDARKLSNDISIGVQPRPTASKGGCIVM